MEKPSEEFIKKIIEFMGFNDCRIETDETHRHGIIFIHDNPALVKEHLPAFVEHLNHLAQLIAKKHGEQAIYFDVNNYRRERENLIIELAKAAARKVMSTKQEISLPVMNSYERRIVHVELAVHPEVTTESIGIGRGRYVVVKPLLQDEKRKQEGFSSEREEAHFMRNK